MMTKNIDLDHTQINYMFDQIKIICYSDGSCGAGRHAVEGLVPTMRFPLAASILGASSEYQLSWQSSMLTR